MEQTMNKLTEELCVKTDVGGIARYKDDQYFRRSSDTVDVPGNPWFICTMWLAEWQIMRAQTLEQLVSPYRNLEWVINHASNSGILSEQLNPFTGEPISVAPLTWSHSTFILTTTRFAEKIHEIAPDMSKEEIDGYFKATASKSDKTVPLFDSEHDAKGSESAYDNLYKVKIPADYGRHGYVIKSVSEEYAEDWQSMTLCEFGLDTPLKAEITE
jgi:hypothetical protein